MPEEVSNADQAEMESRMAGAFRRAYPDVPADRLEHMSRNFTQVVNGIIEIGNRTGDGGEPTHMDVTNGMVYWCMANTVLEDLSAALPRAGGLQATELDAVMREIVARVGDWMLGLEVLRDYPELFGAFVKGAVAAGASDWETSRGGLER